MAIPVVLGMVVQLIYNMVDTLFISMTGNTNLIAGVSVCTPLFTLMLAFGDMFGLGGSSVISRLMGAGKADDGKRLSVFCFYASAIFGVIVSVIMLSFKAPILTFLGADQATFQYASAYYQWIVLGSGLIIFSLVPSNLLRTAGHPNASMIASIIGAVVNIILDPIFIFGLGLGAAGAAMATVLGYVCSDLFAIWFVAVKCEGLSFDVRSFHISGKELGAIFAIGLPSSITNLMQTIGITLTNRSLLPYGSDKIAEMGIVLKVVNIALLVIVGLAFGGQPLTGYIYGSKNKERLKKVIAFAYKIVCGTALVISAIIALLATPIINIFLHEEGLIKEAVLMLRLQMPGMVLMGFGLVAICLFQSMGKGLPALILSLCRQGVVYAVVLAIMASTLGYMGVISAQLVTDIVTTVIALVLLKIYVLPETK